MITVYLDKYFGNTDVSVAKILCFAKIDAEFFHVDKKPALSNGKFISVSHSHGLIAVAISDRVVGVDIEKLREIDYSALCKRFGTVARDEKDFFEQWTRAEAVFKCGFTTVFKDCFHSDFPCFSTLVGDFALSVAFERKDDVKIVDLTL